MDMSSLSDLASMIESDNPALSAARKAIFDNVMSSCSVSLAEAIGTQAKHSAGFMTGKHCRKGFVGSDYQKTFLV